MPARKIITEIEWSVAVDLFLEWAQCYTSAAPALIRHCLEQGKRGKGGPYTIAERRVPELSRTDARQFHRPALLLLRVAMVTAGLAESNGSLPPGL